MRVNRYIRGQIWWLKDESAYNGNIQGKTRPVIIISNDLANRFSNNITVIPCTSQEKTNLPTHISFEINGPSTALCECIQTVSKSNLTNYIGTCDNELVEQLDNAVKVALGLEEISNEQQVIKLSDHIEEKETKTIEKKINTNAGLKYQKYSLEDKIRFINDYKNHNTDYMLKKYNIKDKHSLQQKAYMFRKAINK